MLCSTDIAAIVWEGGFKHLSGSDLLEDVTAELGRPHIVCSGTVHAVSSSTAATQLLHQPTQVISFQMFCHHL